MEKDRKKENTQLESVIDKKGPLRKKMTKQREAICLPSSLNISYLEHYK